MVADGFLQCNEPNARQPLRSHTTTTNKRPPPSTLPFNRSKTNRNNMSLIKLKIITEYNHVKNVKKSCIITINTERSAEDLEDVVLSELFPNDPKFYRVEEWFNSSTRSKIVFEGDEKIRDLGIQDGSVLMVSIVRGRKSRKCVPDTTELVRLCLAADKRKKAEEKKAQQ